MSILADQAYSYLSQDMLVLAFIIVGLVVGLFGNWYRRIIGTVVLAALILTFYYGFLDYASMWLQYDSIEWLTHVGILKNGLSFYVESIDTTFKVSNVHDLFILLQNFGYTPDYLAVMLDGFCKTAVLFIAIIPLGLISFILSFIIYWALLRWIMPRVIRKGFIPRALGGVIGAIEFGAFGFLIIALGAPLLGVVGEVVLPGLKDSTSELTKFLTNNGISTESINSYLNYAQIAANVFNPAYENSFLVKPIFNLLDSMGLNPLYMVKGVIEKDGQLVEVDYRSAFIALFDDVVNVQLGKVNSLMSNV